MSDMHPDDEALSAHLDGDQAAGVRDHVESCEVCTARLAQLRRVRAAVGAPVVPPPARQRDAAIARALAAAGDGAGSRRRVGAWAGGIAAAMLLVLGAAFGLSQLSSQSGVKTVSSGDAKATSPAGETAGRAASEATPPTGAEVADLGDLGPLTDTAALRAVVQPTVAQFSRRLGKATGEAAPPATQAQDAANARLTARPCVDAARALDPANVRPTAVGTATWRGTPADVLVYAVAGRPGAARVYVLARADCRVLEFQSYAP
jgi:hypothetical protein